MLLEYLDVLVADEVSCGILIVLQKNFSLPEVQWKRYAKDKFSDNVTKHLKPSLMLSHESPSIKVELIFDC